MNPIFPKSKAQINRERYAAQAEVKLAQPKRKPIREKRPVWGSQQWAETRGDDLGLSPDF